MRGVHVLLGTDRLGQPEEVERCQDGDEIDEPVETSPGRAAQPAHHAPVEVAASGTKRVSAAIPAVM